MPERTMFSHWDPLNPTNILAAILLWFAFGVYHRPYLPLLYPSYSAFDDLMPWAWWGWAALTIALLLLFTPRFSGWRMLAHALCGMYLLAVAGAFGAGIGVASGVTTYTVLAGVSAILFARTAVYWQSGWRWWRRLVEHPPRWLRWLAGIGEFTPEQKAERKGKGRA